MCGRFVRNTPLSDVAKEFGIDPATFDAEPSYNIAPTQNIVIIVDDGEKKIVRCRWGFLPSWAKDTAIGYKMINARAETVAEKPTFRRAFKKQRCLIIADGFFEWRKEGRVKKPVYIRLKSHKPFGFAGLHNTWISPDGEPICTCTIITTEANEVIGQFHTRMPIIIPKENHDLWLDPRVQESEKLLPLLEPFPSEEMEAYDVSQRVNSPAYNSPENIQPMA